jgi:hypothetical protein
VHKKSAEDATRRLLKVARDHEKAAAEVTQLRLLVSEAERQQADLSAQIAAAQHEAAEATALYQAHKGEVRSPWMATDCVTDCVPRGTRARCDLAFDNDLARSRLLQRLRTGVRLLRSFS